MQSQAKEDKQDTNEERRESGKFQGGRIKPRDLWKVPASRQINCANIVKRPTEVAIVRKGQI
jgi:hypothetical protein